MVVFSIPQHVGHHFSYRVRLQRQCRQQIVSLLKLQIVEFRHGRNVSRSVTGAVFHQFWSIGLTQTSGSGRAVGSTALLLSLRFCYLMHQSKFGPD